MVKAFFSVKALRSLYKSMDEKYRVLLSRRGEDSLAYKDKLFFEVCCFGLPLLNDYLNNNLYSIVNYQRYISIIEACCLMSLGEESDFKSINAPLFEDQYLILLKRTYTAYVPSFIEVKKLDKEYKKAMEHLFLASSRDRFSPNKGITEVELNKMEMPILLGRDLQESIRFYLGYIFIGVYSRSKEFTGLYDYRDIEDKYCLAFFNEVTRMLYKMNKEYECSLTTKKISIPSLKEKSIVSAYKMEMLALDSIQSKINLKYPGSFISSALKRLGQLEISMENILINKQYQDVSSLYLANLEWMANVNSLSSYASSLLNYNFNDKLDSTSSEVKFNSFKKDLTSPNILLFDKSEKDIIFSFIDESESDIKKYCGYRKNDYLKMKYYEACSACFGSGFLFDAPTKRFFAPDVDLFMIMHDLLKEVLTKVANALKTSVDFTVETEILFQALGKKDRLILSLYK